LIKASFAALRMRKKVQHGQEIPREFPVTSVLGLLSCQGTPIDSTVD